METRWLWPAQKIARNALPVNIPMIKASRLATIATRVPVAGMDGLESLHGGALATALPDVTVHEAPQWAMKSIAGQWISIVQPVVGILMAYIPATIVSRSEYPSGVEKNRFSVSQDTTVRKVCEKSVKRAIMEQFTA